ncbi:MAG: hybrid sensor histidine kinase/response regulator [Fibrobacteres bacterium]|nr:hybrid sensor histidine kinase/response regulator [Fibrobacterota bacterium]
MPLQRRLMTMMLVTSGSVLALTCLGFSTYEFITFRHSTVQQLTTIAAIISSNSTAVIAFDDRKGAQEILSALKAEPHIAAAALYDKEGKLFSSYPENLTAMDFPEAPGADGYRFEPAYLIGLQPVVQGTQRLGTLYVKSNMKARSARVRLYGTVAGLMAAVACILAYFLSRTLQGQISSPILSLVETARVISKHGDYSVRARKLGTEELGLLTDAFNHMLARIQEQMARMELLNRITRAIGERLDLPSIFQVISGTLEDNLPVDFVFVGLYEAASNRITVTSVGAKSCDLALAMGVSPQSRIPIDQNGLSRCVNGDLVYESDISRIDFPFPKLLAGQGLRSLVLSPLVVESHVFGVLVTARREAEAFTSTDCEFLRQLSEHAALAANQANLYGALQQAYDDLRQSQQSILQQERLRALGQMASGIAHDINNAISPVTLYTEFLLEKEPNLSPRARDYLQTISNAVEDVAATVARLREFYRLREPEMGLVPVQLNRAVQQVVDLTRARWHDIPQQQGIVINVAVDALPDLPVIMGVEGEIREALTNLFFNAFDAMPDGGTLTLRTRRTDDGMVSMESIDSGVGMDEETRKRCLEPFYTTKGERGTGLGLAMVYGVMQRHGATVEIESASGKGTTIRLLFPIPASTPESIRIVHVVPPPMDILVVDDDPLLLKSLFDTLSGDGHTVVTAGGGKPGIEAFLAARQGNRPFEVVITDLGMPYVDGRKVAAAIHAAHPATPVILLTGWGQRMLAEGDIPPHVYRVLSKPPKLLDLRDVLAECAKNR